MTQPVFEFSAAQAKEAPVIKSTAANPNLLLSLDEISKKKKLEAKKERASKKTGKVDKKDKKEKKEKKDKKDKNRNNKSNDTKDKKKDHKPQGKNGIVKIDVPQSVLKSILNEAGIKTDGYEVTLRAVPKSLD
ncbi:hypothetical protein TVAG_296920 [Trichomonas vaginalis G3]|uniref:Uncharacterized protein n=1 Tax=Trichomonas vaginalis (strain ATCC PRA-98 / G3) TaxID=412133 RepID=A2DR87_TRIV3|nr:hypothetical protein TVAGG3_0512460 [Trichomonas vaginalis G3]EAY17013.1 hypothetical protein TVAG_296920 [Trichomonas vaginalis G3]KAI5517878.1 hypothetical protein TVAGG3_0512460 [Trichomonas vaginalis G3]|eukprot:XP_001329236.1 hypothetical protein [Trichomonas vaginalis G3]